MNKSTGLHLRPNDYGVQAPQRTPPLMRYSPYLCPPFLKHN